LHIELLKMQKMIPTHMSESKTIESMYKSCRAVVEKFWPNYEWLNEEETAHIMHGIKREDFVGYSEEPIACTSHGRTVHLFNTICKMASWILQCGT
jgi:hypothetical protein